MNHIELYAMEIDQREPSPIKAVTIPDQCDNVGWESFDNRWNDTFIMKYMDESFNGVRSVYFRVINLPDDHERIEFTNAFMQGFTLISIDPLIVSDNQYVYNSESLGVTNLILCMVAQRLDAKDVMYESDNKEKMHDINLYNVSKNIWEQVTMPCNIIYGDEMSKLNVSNTNGKDECNNG